MMHPETFHWLCDEIRRRLPRRHRFLFDALAESLNEHRAATLAGINELADYAKAIEQRSRELQTEVGRLRAAAAPPALPAEVIDAVADGFFRKFGGGGQ